MGTLTVNKLGGLSLIIGPILAVVFYMLQPGVMLTAQVNPADVGAATTALASNSMMAHLSGFIIALGLIMMLYGLHVLQSPVRDDGNGYGLTLYGGLLIMVAVIGWIFAQGLVHQIANSGSEAVYSVSLGLNGVSHLAGSLGFLALSLGLSTRDDFNKPAALVVAVVSVISLILGIVGAADSSQLEMTSQVGGIAYIVWTIWGIMLGRSVLQRD